MKYNKSDIKQACSILKSIFEKVNDEAERIITPADIDKYRKDPSSVTREKMNDPNVIKSFEYVMDLIKTAAKSNDIIFDLFFEMNQHRVYLLNILHNFSPESFSKTIESALESF